MTHAHRSAILFLLLAVILVPATALAQRDGVLAGRVIDREGNPVAGALIQITSVGRGDVRELRTDDDGEYLGRGFRPEAYNIVVSAEGYDTEATEYKINLGMNTLDVTLAASAPVGPTVNYDHLNGLYEQSFAAFEREDWVASRDLSAELIAGLAEVPESDGPEVLKMLQSTYEILGRAQLELEAYDEAVAAYDAILTLNPDSVVANVWAGQALTRAGRFDEALPYLKRAAELAPEDASVQYNAGAVMLQLGEVEGGIAAMERAIELRPVFPLARKNLGFAYLRNRDTYAKAIDMLRSYLEQAPDAPDRADVEGMIVEIEAQIRQ